MNAFPFCLPFSLGQVSSSVQLHFAIPNILNRELQQNQLDIALTSSVEYLDGNYTLLPGFGIASHHRVLSVNLYIRPHIQSLEGAKVGLTQQSATSVSLLKTLCHHVWNVVPIWLPFESGVPLTNYDAFLLIGDEAIKKRSIPGFKTLDLGAMWYRLTGLPFVFAIFSIKKGTNLDQVNRFEADLSRALDWSERNFSSILEEAVQRSHLPPDLIREYYTNLRYRLGKEEIESLNLFNSLRQDVPKICP